MSKVDEATAADMKSAAAEMDEAGTVAKMEQGRAKLAESKPTEAGAACQSASDDLKALFSRVSSCQGGMACSIQKRDREATLRAVDELLGVSAEQEKIVAAVETRERIPRSRIVELVAKQADLAEAMSAVATRLFTVSKESFVIDPATFRAIGVVQATMTRAASRDRRRRLDTGPEGGARRSRLGERACRDSPHVQPDEARRRRAEARSSSSCSSSSRCPSSSRP